MLRRFERSIRWPGEMDLILAATLLVAQVGAGRGIWGRSDWHLLIIYPGLAPQVGSDSRTSATATLLCITHKHSLMVPNHHP